MSQCKRCFSHAINPSLHGRQPGVDLDLCDVCYWRVRADPLPVHVNLSPLTDFLDNTSTIDPKRIRHTASWEIDYLRGYLEMPPESTDEEVRIEIMTRLRRYGRMLDQFKDGLLKSVDIDHV